MQALTRLYENQITFAQFYTSTRDQWLKLAGDLLNRWKGQNILDTEDLAQEMLAEVPRLLKEWDPSRGVALSRFVVWNAVNVAKNALHRARGANMHRPDHAVSRAPAPVSSFARDGADDVGIDTIAGGAPPNQTVIDGILDAVGLAQTPTEKRVMAALVAAGAEGLGEFGTKTYARGTYDAAAAILAADGYTGNARDIVSRSARKFATRAVAR